MILAPLITLWCIFARLSLAVTPRDNLIYIFFDNYDIVWPENANKLAYTFLSSYIDETINNSIVLLVDGQILLDPNVPPDEETQNKLMEWIETTTFDSTIRYYQILKDLEEETYQIPLEEITRMKETIGRKPGFPLQDLEQEAEVDH